VALCVLLIPGEHLKGFHHFSPIFLACFLARFLACVRVHVFTLIVFVCVPVCMCVCVHVCLCFCLSVCVFVFLCPGVCMGTYAARGVYKSIEEQGRPGWLLGGCVEGLVLRYMCL
jgi:hypothetical protein